MNRPGGEGVGEPFSREIEMVPFYLSADRNNSNKRLMIFGAILRNKANMGLRSESAQTSAISGKLPHINAGDGNVSGGVGSGGGVPAITRLFEGNVSYDYRRLTPNTASATCAPTSAAGPVL